MRTKKGLTLRDLSKRIKLGHAYLSDIENNRKPAPNDKALIKMATIFELNSLERELFFDSAVLSKSEKDLNNFYLPADISLYIIENDAIKNTIRKNIKENVTDE